jgi:hypothetical protein
MQVWWCQLKQALLPRCTTAPLAATLLYLMMNWKSTIKDTMSESKEVRGAITAIKSHDDKAMSQYGCSKGD